MIQIIELLDGFAPVGSGGTGTLETLGAPEDAAVTGGTTFGKGAANLAGTGIPGSGMLGASSTSLCR